MSWQSGRQASTLIWSAGVHADMVGQYINRLNCPSEQKVQLIDEIIHSAVKEKTD